MARLLAACATLIAAAGCGGEPPAPLPGALPAGTPLLATPDPDPVATVPPSTVTPAAAKRVAFDLGLPDRPWALRFAWPAGVDVTRDHITPAGDTRTCMGVTGRAALSVLIRPAPAGARDAASLRDQLAVDLPVQARSPVEDVTRWEVGAVACAQWRLPRFRGVLDRVERHCLLVRDGFVAHLTLLWDQPTPDTLATLDAWTASIAIIDRPVPPPADALAFGRALVDAEDDATRARAVAFLDAAAAARATLDSADRVRLGLACTDAWIAVDRDVEALQLLDALLAELPDPRLYYCRARLHALADRHDAWEASLRAAFAAPHPAGPLPDPREEPAFLSVPEARFEAVMRAIGRGK